MITFSGRYFPRSNSDFIEVAAQVTDDGILVVVDQAGQELARASWLKCKISSRVGSIPREIKIPDFGMMETQDNDAVDAIERKFRKIGFARIGNVVESSPKYIFLSFIGFIAIISAYLIWGVPMAAERVARHLPEEVERYATKQALDLMDRIWLDESKLPKDRQFEVQDIFSEAVAASGLDRNCCVLLFREGGAISANAFALPDGTIVMTEELVALAEHDDELFGIFAHELGHVAQNHGMRMGLQSSLVTLTIIFVTADLGQFGEIAVALPSILLETGYSRDFEREADGFAAELMIRAGRSPASLADILENLEQLFEEEFGSNGENQDWLSTHPATEDRKSFLRNYPIDKNIDDVRNGTRREANSL